MPIRARNEAKAKTDWESLLCLLISWMKSYPLLEIFRSWECNPFNRCGPFPSALGACLWAFLLIGLVLNSTKERMLMWASPHSQDPVLFVRLPPYPISISLANEEQTDKPRCRLHFRKMRDWSKKPMPTSGSIAPPTTSGKGPHASLLS